MYTKPAHRKNIDVRFTCTHAEKRYLAICARKAGQSVSHYLHEMMLQGYPDKPKSLPPEVQAAIGQLRVVQAGQPIYGADGTPAGGRHYCAFDGPWKCGPAAPPLEKGAIKDQKSARAKGFRYIA